jgi:hypothetical protein
MCDIKKRKNFVHLITYFLLFALPFILLPEPFLLFAQQIEEGEKLLKEGIDAIKQGAYDVAITRLEQAISILKDKDKLADAFFYLGLAYFAFKRVDKVKELMNEMLKLKPEMKLDTEQSSEEFLALWEEVKKETLASLTIVTIPAEADIYLDGELMGKSPLKISNLFPREHNLRLIKEDYEAKEELITLDPRLEKKVEIRLIKMPPKITVTPSEKKPEVKKSKAWIWFIIGGVTAAVAVLLLKKGGEKETQITPATTTTSTTTTTTSTTTSSTTTTIAGNQRPVITDLQGPTSCSWGQTVQYQAIGYDPDGTQVSYRLWIERDDGRQWELGWTPWVSNNIWAGHSVTWNKETYSGGSDQRNFKIYARIKDYPQRDKSEPISLRVTVSN